jgi:TPR repeat protein
MRVRILLSFLILLLVAPLTLAGPQAPGSTQADVKSAPSQPKWTEDHRKELLAKAQRGEAGPQMWLAAAYEQGWFGKTNVPEALKWYRKSAKNRNPDAQNDLGRMYEDGEGVKQNYALAAKWYRKAAEHVPDLGGAGQGRNNLGMLYLEGRGVPKDYVQAYMWFRLFRREQNANLIYAKEHMTQEQILEAERKAEEWKERRHDLQD